MSTSIQERLAALKAKAAAKSTTSEPAKTEEVKAPEPAAKPAPVQTPVDPLDALDAAWDTVPSVEEIEKSQAVQLGTDLVMKITELEDALKSAHPKLPTLLKEIHSRLRSDAEVVSMLEPASIGTIVTALRKFQGIELLQKATKSKTTKANLKNVTVDEL